MMIQRDSHSVTQLGFKLTHLEIILEISLVGRTQTLFRDLPKFPNIEKIFTSSCSALKIVPFHEI